MPSAWILPLLLAASGAADAAQPSAVPDEEGRAVEEALRQLVAEAEDTHSLVDGRGWRSAILWTRPRATSLAGICERDRLEIALEPAPAGPDGGSPGRVRSVKAERQYRVAADEAGEPHWDLTGGPLETACAKEWPGRHGWTSGDGPWPVAAAVRGLAAARRELQKPRTKIVIISCAPSDGCEDRPRIVSLIDPIEPGPVFSRGSADGCPEERSCIETSVSDLANCGWWEVRLEFDGGDYDRLRRAQLRPSFGAIIACAERNAGF